MFDTNDLDVIDSDVLRRVIKFANSTSGDLSHASQDIQELKVKMQENTNDIEKLKSEVDRIEKYGLFLSIVCITQFVVIIAGFAYIVMQFYK